MCVLASNRADVYNTIKMVTLCDMGIPSQVNIILTIDKVFIVTNPVLII